MPHARGWLTWSVLLFLGAVALGVVVTDTALTTPDELAIDQQLQLIHTGWATGLLTGVTDIASPIAGVLILAVWVLGLLAVHRPVRAVQTFLVIAIGWNVTLVLKLLISRHRPAMATEASKSFPSGHVSFAVACAFAAYFLLRGTRWQRPVTIVGVLAVGLVMFSRIYLGAHYLTDTIGSVLITAAAVVFLTGVWPLLHAQLHLVPLLGRFGSLEDIEITRVPGVHHRTG